LSRPNETSLSSKVSDAIAAMPKSPFYKIMDYVKELKLEKEVIYLNVGNPHFVTPSHIREAAKKALDQGFTYYTPEAGIMELREAIAEKLKKENKIEADPATEIFVTNGAQAALYGALKTLLNYGDEVLIPCPYYPPYRIDTDIIGGKPVLIPFNLGDRLTLEPEEVEKHITERTKAILIHSPNNPTGGVLTRKNLEDIAEVAMKHMLPVITDECYEKFLYEDAEHFSMASIPGMEDLTITINSFSKTYSMTGWRLGYLTADRSFMNSFLKVHHTINICTNSIAQKAAVAALTGPQDFFREWLSVYKDNRRAVVEGVKKIPSITFAAKPLGTFYAFLDIRKLGMKSYEACEYFVREAKVVVTPGSGFGPVGEGCIRISYATQIENIKNAFENIRAAVEKI